MRRFLYVLRNDFILQGKYGIYIVYGVIVAVYILLLNKISQVYLSIIIPFILFTDPSFVGFYFIGGLVLFEKGENILEYLVVTPLRIKEYLFSKMVSLTTLAILASIIIIRFSYNGELNLPLLLIGIILTSCFFTLIGFVAVSRFDTVNKYIITSVLYITLLSIPLLGYFNIYNTLYFYLFPTQASLILIRGAFEPIESWEFFYSFGYLTVLNLFVYRWAYSCFCRYIIEGEEHKV